MAQCILLVTNFRNMWKHLVIGQKNMGKYTGKHYIYEV